MDLHDLTAAYALDALDADETMAYEEHLAQCESCRSELSALSESATALAWAVHAPLPSAALRNRVLDAAAAERTNVVSLPLRNPWLLRATASLAAVAACTAAGLGIWAGTLHHSVSKERSARANDATAVQILADPASRRVPIDGGGGVLAIDADGQGVLVVRRLPRAPAGKTYEAWVIPPGGKAKRAGIFTGGEATTIVRLGRPVAPGAMVAATLERAGGVSAPTQSAVFRARA